MGVPSSKIYVCSNVRLNNRYEHTIWFSKATAQRQYFEGKVAKTFSSYTYLRKSWNIKVDATMEEARKWTYLFFDNGDGKTYYYFITNIEYIGERTVELKLEMDVMQTYLFDVSIPPCFVEREHSVTDDIGENLMDEGLDTGEIVNHEEQIVVDGLSELCILVMTTIDLVDYTRVNASKYNDIFGGCALYMVDMDNWKDLGRTLSALDADGKSDAVMAIWMYPKALVMSNEEATETPTIDPLKIVYGNKYYMFADLKRPETVGGYKPRNKKLFCYPYNFLYATNNNGVSAVYHYERFYNTGDVFRFDIEGCLSPEAQAVMYPRWYNKQSRCYDEGLLIGGFPTCAWNQDIYKIWLAQNQHQNGLAMGMATLKIVGGIGAIASTAGGNVMGAVGGASAVASGISDISSMLAQKADREIQPPQAKGTASGSVNVTMENQTFTFYHRGVDTYHAMVIDDFFTMYGYKTMQVKEPNRDSRPHFNYVKTIGCHAIGDLCTEDLTKIESVYNNGVTFWKNGDKIGDYSLNNSV